MPYSKEKTFNVQAYLFTGGEGRGRDWGVKGVCGRANGMREVGVLMGGKV
jgi:hypothetical protein